MWTCLSNRDLHLWDITSCDRLICHLWKPDLKEQSIHLQTGGKQAGLRIDIPGLSTPRNRIFRNLCNGRTCFNRSSEVHLVLTWEHFRRISEAESLKFTKVQLHKESSTVDSKNLHKCIQEAFKSRNYTGDKPDLKTINLQKRVAQLLGFPCRSVQIISLRQFYCTKLWT
jgi:hypothetical protein